MPERTDRSGGRVVAVLGYSCRGDTELHPVCAARLAHAERLAVGARAVILSGSARRSIATTEAERMRAAWRGPDIPVICDSDARSTAENAANIVAAASALGADELVVVTSRWHRLRASILLRTASRGRGMRLTVEGPTGLTPRGAALREIACLALLPLQLPRTRRRPAC